MFYVSLECNSWDGEYDDRNKYGASFTSLDDALMFAAFYAGLAETADDNTWGYWWHVRCIVCDESTKSPALMRPSDIPSGFARDSRYLGSPLLYDGDFPECTITQAEADALPVDGFMPS